MAIQQKTYTAEEFWEFVNRPENQNKSFERRHGEIIEVTPSNTYFSGIGIAISSPLFMFVKAHDLGVVSGEAGGFELSEDITYVPDVAFVSKARQAEPPRKTLNPIAPDLAVEVISPTNSASEIQRKVLDYLAAGTLIVWIAYPETKTVVVHTSAGARTLTEADTLDGGDVLPGFTLPVRDIFPQ